MTKYKCGDIVLVDFGFSEEKGSKKRPALIISSDNYHKNRQEVIAVAITHNIRRVLSGDTKIDEWKKAGLIYPSLVTGIIRTIKNSMIVHWLGVLSQQDFWKVHENLRKAIGL
ncbi:MAG: type II toxin-antitoxin system PemK/MazF family toxin [Candidatus Omnitrophica bacterium]|nr:type II toxin-antitoxin system PemK/MazF family toxin [Candidatus Omnitrophota bacterium]MBU1133706.1 type II toxin-antitoxin system PemK/MazF family toxin [Candidatus Omnitrophota bacterium]MBU1810188.1 type II toxin-antitoxin system PemK/MazF family toxin [Candidatus Omnitrophota bacterium]MBU2504397.1 type II toxin-antitoxin system PemK/MazF family toxin [Candidatus Omnitrophota bacterium]